MRARLSLPLTVCLLATAAPAAASASTVELRVRTVDGNAVPSPGMITTLTAADGTLAPGGENATIFDAAPGTRVRGEVTGQGVRSGAFVRDPDCALADPQITRGVGETTATDSPQVVDLPLPQMVASLTAPEIDAAEADLAQRLNAYRTAGGLSPLVVSPAVSRVADAMATRSGAAGRPTGVGENCGSLSAMSFELGVFGVAAWGYYGRDTDSGPEVAAGGMTSGATGASLRSPSFGALGVAYADGYWFVAFGVSEVRELHPLPARPRVAAGPTPGTATGDDAPAAAPPKRCARVVSTRRRQSGVRVTVSSRGRLTVRAPRTARVRLGTRTLRLRRGRVAVTLPRGRTQTLRVTVRRKGVTRTTTLRVAGACR